MKTIYTCYHCAKTIKGAVKHTGICGAARKTGWDRNAKIAVNLDFPKAWHSACYDKAETAAAKEIVLDDYRVEVL